MYTRWLRSSAGICLANIRFLESDEVFMRAMQGKIGEAESKHATMQLEKIYNSQMLIDNIFIVDRESQTVHSYKNNYNMNDFFKHQYAYEQYPELYWKSYRTNISEKQILPPSVVANSDVANTIIPIVFTRIGDTYTKNILVVNVSIPHIFTRLENVDDDIKFGIVSRYYNIWIDGMNNLTSKLSNDFVNKIVSYDSIAFECEFEGENSFIVSHSPMRSILGYTYAAIIPHKLVAQKAQDIVLNIILICIGVVLLVVLLTQISVNKIYQPIKSLQDMVGTSTDGNELAQIQSYIRTAKEKDIQYMPIVQERLLVEFLNDESPDIEKTKIQFMDNEIKFLHPCFCSIIIRLRLTAEYFKAYNTVQFETMMKNMLEFVCSYFFDEYDTYTLPIKSDKLYILLNAEKSLTIENIEVALNKFAAELAYDKKLVYLRFAIGGIYEGLEGLKKSHTEAIRTIEGIAEPVDSQSHSIQIPEKRSKHSFGSIETSKLFDLLIAENISEARKYINQIIQKNLSKNTSQIALYNLYIQISHIILNVMRVNKIDFENESVENIDVTAKLFSLPPDELFGKIEDMLNSIENNPRVSKLNILEIIAYIQQNYMEDIRLNELADKYHISLSYLSRSLKDALGGVTFLEYLTNLRINKAKELIATTEKSITEISAEVGFVDRTAFTRAFKIHTGMTPTQYKKNRKM